MTTPTEAPREALPEPLKVVAWLTVWEKDRIRGAGSHLQRHEPMPKWPDNSYEPLVRLTDAQSALESERQAHAAEVERLRMDAERYRWLRDGKNPGNRYPHLTQYPYQPDLDKVRIPQMVVDGRLRAENLDAAIDQAIARGKT